MDMKSTFFNGHLEGEIYKYHPQRIEVLGNECFFCRLMNPLYGLKQAPKAWYIKIDKYLVEQGFQWSPLDANLYIKRSGNDIILLVIYVDDMIIIGSETNMIE